MIIKFELGQNSYLRHFEGVIDALRKKGHTVERTAFWHDTLYPRKSVMSRDHREVLMREAKVRKGPLGELSYVARCARDYLLYRRAGFPPDTLIAKRIKNHLKAGYEGSRSPLGIELADFIGQLSTDQAAQFDRLLRRVESHVPHDPEIEKLFIPTMRTDRKLKVISALLTKKSSNSKPDIMCITPLVVTQLGQTELVKTARTLRIPIVFLANSWDNLSTKGTIHVKPDWTIVWNEIQAREAVELHGIPKDSIKITGAPRFDGFFLRKPTVSRSEFFNRRGLNPKYPAVAYLGSSNLISTNEAKFVLKWIQALRNSPLSALSKANILLRPHPKFKQGWKNLVQSFPRVALCASDGLNNDELLFHTLFHSHAVVGANTSAEIEAAILHKPVFSIREPFFSTGQDQTAHYRYLLRKNGGFVYEASCMTEHLAQLSGSLMRGEQPGRNRSFLEWFVRPSGLEQPAAEVTANVISNLSPMRGK
jgi:hypothetical protein